MGRLWLALALLVTITGDAAAKREPACACRHDVVLPRVGAVDVPTNAHFWYLRADGVLATPDRPIQPYELAPHTAYALSSPPLSFTTGAGRDETPPLAPGIGAVSFVLSSAAHGGTRAVTLLHIAGTFDPDTAVIRLTIGDDQRTYVTTPDALTICDTGLELAARPTTVTIVALDLAGNASPPTTYTTTPVVDRDPPRICRPGSTRHRGGLDYIVVFMLAPFVLAILYCIYLAIAAASRANRRRTAEPTPLPVPAAEALARDVRRSSAIGIGVVVVAGVLAFRSDVLAVLMLLVAPSLLIGVVVAAYRWYVATRLLRLAAYDGATATLRDTEVRVSVGGKHAILRATPARVRRAQDHGLPRATA